MPASKWAAFERLGKIPESIVRADMFAILEWLPTSGYLRTNPPEMEVYFPCNDGLRENRHCEFWLPIMKKVTS